MKKTLAQNGKLADNLKTVGEELQGYPAIAEALGMARMTLSRKILEYNKAQTDESKKIQPDLVEDHGHYRTHKFNAVSIAKIRQLVEDSKSKAWRRRGRPRKY